MLILSIIALILWIVSFILYLNDKIILDKVLISMMYIVIILNSLDEVLRSLN